MIVDNSFITLHRKIIQWEWYTDNNTRSLFIHLLLIANHKETKWRGEVIRRGQVLTGLDLLSKSTGMSIQEIRTSINKLKSTSEITSRSTNKYRVITINNYDSYQSLSRDNQQANQQTIQQSSNSQATASNNDNNDNKFNNKNTLLTESILCASEGEALASPIQFKPERKEVRVKVTPPGKMETAVFFTSNGSTNEEAGRFWYHYDSAGWLLGNGRKMKSWTSAAHKWILNSNKYSNQNNSSYARNSQSVQRDANGISKQDHFAATKLMFDAIREKNSGQPPECNRVDSGDERKMLH